jgi:hypothetical protein
MATEQQSSDVPLRLSVGGRFWFGLPAQHHSLGLWSEGAEELLLGTAIVESGLTYRGPVTIQYSPFIPQGLFGLCDAVCDDIRQD